LQNQNVSFGVLLVYYTIYTHNVM